MFYNNFIIFNVLCCIDFSITLDDKLSMILILYSYLFDHISRESRWSEIEKHLFLLSNYRYYLCFYVTLIFDWFYNI